MMNECSVDSVCWITTLNKDDEHHPATDFYPEGYEVYFFFATGDTLTVVSVPATSLRTVTGNDVFHVREKVKKFV